MKNDDPLYWWNRGFDKGYEAGQREAREQVRHSLGINGDWLMNRLADPNLKDKVKEMDDEST